MVWCTISLSVKGSLVAGGGGEGGGALLLNSLSAVANLVEYNKLGVKGLLTPGLTAGIGTV